MFSFSPDETEYWCGSCTVPLAMVVLEDAGEGTEYVVTKPVKRTVIAPVEPQVSVYLSVIVSVSVIILYTKLQS